MYSSPDASFVLAVASWATLQLTWTGILLLGQLFQISRQMTSFEVSNLGRYGFMGGRAGSSMAMQQGHQHTSPDAATEEDDPNPAAHGRHGHSHGPGGHSHGHGASGCYAFLMNLLGLDRFTRGKAADGFARAAGKSANPFDTGYLSNCSDFWTKGREIGVHYEALYDVPPEGFRAAKRHMSITRDDDEESIGLGNTAKRSMGLASRYIPGFLGRGRSGSNPYQAVSTSENV